MKCERSEGVGEAQNETGERERKRVGGKGQALPWKLGAISWLHVFPLVPHPPPTPFHFPPGPLVFPLLQPRLSSLLSFRSLYHDHTPFTFLSLSLSVCHIPPLLPASLALYINHTLVFLHHLTLSSLTGFISTHSLFFFPPFFFSIFLSPPLFLFSQLLRLNPQLCAKSSKEETERLKSNIKKKRQKKKIKPPPDARELWSQRKGDGREERGAKKEETLSMKTEWLA